MLIVNLQVRDSLTWITLILEVSWWDNIHSQCIGEGGLFARDANSDHKSYLGDK